MTLSVKLGDDIENRLSELADITGRTKTYYIKKAVLEMLEDMEDIYITEKRIENKSEKIWSMKEIEAELDLAH